MENDETLASGDPPAPPVDKPGSRVGKYELLRPLGAGGMGVVWAARDPDLDREVAIKLLRSANAGPEQRTRLLREARAMARLKHPNVLTVYEVDTDGTRDFIAMELVDGTNLDTWLQTKPPAHQVWDALLAAGRGLAAAHDAGLVHRDFKPHNVLRSRDGRVLVTDFGLARGQADEPALAATLDPGTSAGDSILDVKLTTTGQLLGTPAYMATEQFAGEMPDPRTDQFAFCVTAWEALTGGERPYAGTTIDELRSETAAGAVAEGTLPSSVRRVLVRGLSPQRANRWSDMRTLLAALERSRHAWRIRALVAVPVLAVAAAATIFALHSRTPAAVPTHDACLPGEQMFASVWSPAIRDDVLQHHPEAKAIASQLDAYRQRWLAGYAKACTLPVPQRTAVIGCYSSARDEAAVVVEVLQRFPSDIAGRLDLAGVQSSTEPCQGNDPVAPPSLPEDERRPKVIELLAKLHAATATAPATVVSSEDIVREQMKAIAWQPLEAMVDEAIGASARQTGQLEIAARSYRKSADVARASRNYVLEARARLGILEVGMDDIVDDMPRHAYDEQLHDAELAIKNAGSPAALVAALDLDRGIHAALVAGELSRAIQILDGAHAVLAKSHDRIREPRAAALLAEYLAVRAAPGDLERATSVLADAHALLDTEPLSGKVLARDLVTIEYWLAWLRGDLAKVHAVLDTRGMHRAVGSTKITGRVVNAVGVPVPGALVVAWHGELFGDATRVFTDPTFDVTTVVTDATGAFTVEVSDGSAVIAELEDRRSAPGPARNGVDLTLRPTHAIGGTVDAGGDPATGIDPFVRFDVTPMSSWVVSTAASADGRFRIAGLPDQPHARLGALGSHWPRETGRRVDAGEAVDQATIHWPVGNTTDIQARAKTGIVWEFRAALHPTTRIEVEKLARTAPDVATLQLTPVGWGNMTFAGIENYQPGDRHAVIRDNGSGPQTICINLDDKPAVECHTYDEAPEPGVVRDGRHWFGSSSTLFSRPASGSQQHPLGAVLRSDP